MSKNSEISGRNLYKFNNPPLESADINTQLVKALEKAYVPMVDAPHALKDIAAIGALITDEKLVRSPDLSMLVTACKTMAEGGMPIHPTPSLRVFNLLAPIKSDFLETAFNYSANKRKNLDLAVVCYVPTYSPNTNSVTMLHPEQLQMQNHGSQLYKDYAIYGLDRLKAVSLFQDNCISWGVAAHEHGAKFVATCGGARDEIHSNHFVDSEQYKPLISTLEGFKNASIGYSSGSFGFVVNKNHAKAAAQHANTGTLLGQRLKYL